jgi:hypothetical protein
MFETSEINRFSNFVSRQKCCLLDEPVHIVKVAFGDLISKIVSHWYHDVVCLVVLFKTVQSLSETRYFLVDIFFSNDVPSAADNIKTHIAWCFVQIWKYDSEEFGIFKTRTCVPKKL